MTTANLPQSLPFLPGNVYADPTITRYHKTQLLGVKDGIITGKCATNVTLVEKTTNLQENIDDTMLTSMREGAATGLTGMPQRPSQANDAIPKIAPKWLKHDRHVSVLFCSPNASPVSRRSAFGLLQAH